MEKARKQSFKKLLPLMILLGIAAVALLALSVPGVIKMIQGPEDMDYLEYDESQSDGGFSGKYVEGTVYFIYDYYCETTKGSSLISREYIIDADNTYYMGMLVKKSGIDEAETLYEACYEYMSGTADENAVYAAEYTVRGTIHAMPSDSEELYYEYLDYCGLSSEDQEMFLPYYLEVGAVGSFSVTATIIMLLIAILLIVAIIVLIVRWANGGYQKEISAYLAANGNSEMARAHVNAFFEATEGQGPIRCTQEFISAQDGAATMFRKAEDLVWVYKKTITHKRNFITVGHSYYLVLTFLDGKQHQILMKKEADADEQLQRLNEMYPRAVVGYSDELVKLFSQNREEFLRIRYYAAPEQYQTE